MFLNFTTYLDRYNRIKLAARFIIFGALFALSEAALLLKYMPSIITDSFPIIIISILLLNIINLMNKISKIKQWILLTGYKSGINYKWPKIIKIHHISQNYIIAKFLKQFIQKKKRSLSLLNNNYWTIILKIFSQTFIQKKMNLF